jgi:death-on-curing protein
MRAPVWIDLPEGYALHAMLLDRFGGLEGVREAGLLESALRQPPLQFSFGETSMFALAARYARGIVQNHPFIDGNKRTGFMVAALFLELNGYRFEASETEVVIFTRSLAAGEIALADYAAWLERCCAGPKSP